MARAQRGDVGAFEELIRRTYGLVLSVCRGVCGSGGEAEDAAQETFVRAWRALPGFRGDAAVTTWLYRIATNVSLTAVRRRRPTAQPDELPDIADVRDDPSATAEGFERVAVVRAALAELSDDARAAFVLRDVEGLSYDDIADALGISLGAVKSRIFRARQHIAGALQAYDVGAAA